MNPAFSWTPHKANVARDFSAAAPAYNRAARLQRQVIDRLLQLAPPARPAPDTLLDLGCGTGLAIEPLADRFPASRLLALDLAEGMLSYARAASTRSVTGWIAGDAEALPLQNGAVDLVFSSLAIQWCQDTPAVLRELARVLRPDGRLLVSTLVDGTLAELKNAWRQVDRQGEHVNRFYRFDELAAQVAQVFPDARVIQVPVRLLYPDLGSLLRELKDLGARYKGGGASGMTAPGRLRQLARAYQQWAQADGRLPATYQVALIYR